MSLCWSTADREGELDSKSRSDDHVFRDFDLLIRSQYLNNLSPLEQYFDDDDEDDYEQGGDEE